MDELDYLTDSQTRLLFDVVEAYRKVNTTFYMLRAMSEGDRLQHPGFEDEYHMSQPDALVLRNMGLLTVVRNDRNGAFHFIPSPAAYAAYEVLHCQMGDATAAAETDTRGYFESEGFRTRHAVAFKSLDLAAQLVWNRNSDRKLSDVGHHCRVALQEFTESLLQCMGLVPDESDKERTRDRASQALFAARERGLVGDTMETVLNALFQYWVAIYNLACKQEHAANREPAATDWEDARVLVFQSLFVMAEFDRRLCR